MAPVWPGRAARTTPIHPSAIALFAFAGMAGFALITTLYLQEARDYSALQAGPVFVPVAAAAKVSGPLAGRLVANRGSRILLIAAGQP